MKFFYPPSFRRLIKKYRDAGDLNEQVITRMNKKIWFQLILGCIVVFLIFWGKDYYLWAAAVTLLLAGVMYHVHYETNLYIIPYTEGYIVNGILTYIEFTSPGPGSTKRWKMTCNFQDRNGVQYTKHYQAMEKSAFSNDIKAGDNVPIAIHPYKAKCSYPYLQHYIKDLCLSKKPNNINSAISKLII